MGRSTLLTNGQQNLQFLVTGISDHWMYTVILVGFSFLLFLTISDSV